MILKLVLDLIFSIVVVSTIGSLWCQHCSPPCASGCLFLDPMIVIRMPEIHPKLTSCDPEKFYLDCWARIWILNLTYCWYLELNYEVINSLVLPWAAQYSWSQMMGTRDIFPENQKRLWRCSADLQDRHVIVRTIPIANSWKWFQDLKKTWWITPSIMWQVPHSYNKLRVMQLITSRSLLR